MDCSLPGSSVHGISQVRVLEWVAISFSKNVVYVLTLEFVNVTLFGKRVFEDIIKTLEWDNPQFRVGPKSNGRCPYKRQGEGDLR